MVRAAVNNNGPSIAKASLTREGGFPERWPALDFANHRSGANHDAKKCPYCAEEIQAEAVKCKHCGTWLDGAPEAVSQPVEPYAPGAGEAVRALLDEPHDCRRLRRDRQYLGIDPTIVRVVVAVVTFFTAIVPGLVIYMILAFVIPSDDAPVY